MDSSEQLAFWPLVNQAQYIVSDDWMVERLTVEFDSTPADEITVGNEWKALEDDWQARLDLVLLVRSPGWSSAVVKSHSAPLTSITGLVIGAVQGKDLSPYWLAADWPSAEDRDVVARLMIREIAVRKTRTRKKSLVSSLMHISRDAVRQQLVQAWTRVVSRTPDEVELVSETPSVADTRFIPSKALVEMVRD
jgi:hypothetical protein